MARAGKFASNFHIDGLAHSDPLPRRMLRFSNLKARDDAFIKAMKDAAEPMRLAMSKGAPLDTGALSQSFSSEKLRKVPQNILGIRVGAVSGEGVWSGNTFQRMGWRDHFAELGTRHHAAHPHVQPAIKSKLPVYRKKLRVNLAALIKQYSR